LPRLEREEVRSPAGRDCQLSGSARVSDPTGGSALAEEEAVLRVAKYDRYGAPNVWAQSNIV
jgi:hypothetical protein